MRVNGANGINISAAALGMEAGGSADPQVKDLQNQIQNLQKQLKELGSNSEMPAELKSRKRQDLQKQISDLEAQLRQRQIEVKHEEAVKKQQKKGGSLDEMLGAKPQAKKDGRQSAGMSAGSMEALISADASLKQADVHGSTAQKMEGRAGVLEAEISMDSMSGGASAVASKKEQLAEAQAKAAEAASAQMGSLAQAAEEAKKAGEAENSREDTSEKSGDKAEKSKDGRTGAAQEGEKTDGTDNGSQAAAVVSENVEETGEQPQNTFDTAMLGVSFSRGYQTVDVKL